MYDPILIEELAEWLNGGALQDVGVLQTADPESVQMWCHEAGVCCLPKLKCRLRAGCRHACCQWPKFGILAGCCNGRALHCPWQIALRAQSATAMPFT